MRETKHTPTLRASHKTRGRVYHHFRKPLTLVLGRATALCGAKLSNSQLNERIDHLHGCFRCDERSRALKSTRGES